MFEYKENKCTFKIITPIFRGEIIYVVYWITHLKERITKYITMNYTNGYHFLPFLNRGIHFGQYHLPFGFVVNCIQPKWNHSIGQSVLSQPIISPYDTCWHKQYVGSFGSTGMSMISWGTVAHGTLEALPVVPLASLLALAPFLLVFLPLFVPESSFSSFAADP